MIIERPESKQRMPANAKKVFSGVIFDVFQWEQKGYDGKIKIFEKLRRPDTVIIIPITEDGRIIITEQEQPGKKPYIGSVGGRVDPGESVLAAAERELLEETGYVAKEWVLFDAVQPASKIEWAVFTFIAKGCKKVTEQDLDGAEKIALRFCDFNTFFASVVSGEFSEPEMQLRFLEAKLHKQKLTDLKNIFLK